MEKYMEISKKYNKKESIEKGMYNIWDNKRIKRAFNFGNGTMKDFKRYMKDNNQNCYFQKI